MIINLLFKMKNTLIVMIAVILAGVAGFYGGTKYQQTQARSGMMMGQMGGRPESGEMRQGTTGSRPVSGEIIDQAQDSITVKLQDGGSKIILLSKETEIKKAQEGSLTDLVAGESVVVFGTENTDGSISATNVQLSSGMQPNFK